MLCRLQGDASEIYAWKGDNNSLSFYAYTDDEIKLTSRMKNKHSRMKPIERMVCWWVDKDIKIACEVAYTTSEKMAGLQNTPKLPANKGMYFPYAPSANVTFHQGSVSYPLDILFIRNDEVVKIQAGTKPGGKDTWSCSACDAVIEVQGGFCQANDVQVGDIISFIGLTVKDLADFAKQEPVEEEEYYQTAAGKGYCPSITSEVDYELL